MFQTICDVIVLITAAILGIGKVFELFGKPISFAKNKRKEEIKEIVEENIEEKLLDYFEKKKVQTRDIFLKDRENCLTELKKEVLNETKEPIEEIKETLLELKNTIEVLKDGSKDVLRQKIMAIYHEYKHERKFPLHAKEALDELYKDYKKEGGNSYIDKYYNRTKAWEVDYSEEEE